ncbi:hypothetical protein CAPTEDRAFT_186379 [Capitella teleta]|uniref:C2H2-type domain-containing protein n=1 Tax=Capitella teleta TaxID=283909 RepID=R7TZA5_CAPTE|nr:hypothetical protein CAPTEDRAFT_186379 [Capitella teleta]|eukprot:ELT98957.1 hypothetical protein CAPTEDRAFT_186379 [Capitella teleta]
MALAQRLENLLQATVLQICREIVPFTDTVSLTGDLSVEADSREVCRVTFRRNDTMKTPSPRVGQLPFVDEALSGGKQSLVDSLVAEAMKVWYNEGPSPDRSRVQEIRAEYSQDSRKSIAVELGVEAMTKYGQISPETLEAAAQLRRLADHAVIQFDNNGDREKHERKQKLIANQDFESTPLNGKCHTPIKNSNGMYACPDCGKEFTFGTNLTRHQRNFHGRPFTRKKDGKRLELTENNANLMNTFEEMDATADKKGNYTCVLCERTFSQLNALSVHLKDSHSMLMSDAESLRQGESPGCYPCPTCAQTFSFRLNLQRHIATMHKEDVSSEQSFECESCSMTFPKQSMLSRHVRKVHKGPQQQQQPDDSIAVSPLPSSTHAPPSPALLAPFAGSFTALMQQSPLMQTDSSTNPLLLPHRQYTEEQESDISPPAPPPPPPPGSGTVYSKCLSIQCPLCTLQFSFRTNLVRHMRQAHKKHDRPNIMSNQVPPGRKGRVKKQQRNSQVLPSSQKHRHTCPVCQLSFTFRTNLTRHMRKQHNQVPEEHDSQSIDSSAS